HGDRVSSLRATERAAREYPDDDDAGATLRGVIEQAPEVLRPEPWGQRVGGAGVQKIEADLRGLHERGVEHLVQRGRLAQRRDAIEADLALLDEPGERGHDRV